MKNITEHMKKFHKHPFSASAFAVLLGIGMMFGMAMPASAAAATMYITPTNSTKAPGETLTVFVHVNTGGQPVNAVQSDFSYNQNRLQFQDMDAVASGWTIFGVSSGGGGTVKITAGTTGQGTTSSDLTVAKVTFRVLDDLGSANISFLASSMVANGVSNADILGSTSGASYTVSPNGGGLLANTGDSLFYMLTVGFGLIIISAAAVGWRLRHTLWSRFSK